MCICHLQDGKSTSHTVMGIGLIIHNLGSEIVIKSEPSSANRFWYATFTWPANAEIMCRVSDYFNQKDWFKNNYGQAESNTSK